MPTLNDTQQTIEETKASIDALSQTADSTKTKIDGLVARKYWILGGAMVLGVLFILLLIVITIDSPSQPVVQTIDPTPRSSVTE
ncbi:hypothetical protein [Thiobaca trueperi]|uniref:Uncharacterized protein n=1 Tax=Thiobaca trueperi TaxID=127458 RepID=A0A4R3N6K9_9GAMM|nr:hypothetical protein [Thiobaca trueperi]TCT24117.1 hypothetical protein EDC35_101437 [Thiobaca trueperi]